MSATVGLPSSVVIRDLMLTLWFNRWRIFLITIGAMAIATYVALQVQPKYQSNSSMLVLLGPEYGSRPVAGQQLTGAINVLPQELLHTESDILASRDLHRSVIEQIGVAKLYPELLKPPGAVAQFFKQVLSYIKDFLGLAEVQQTTGAGGSAAVAAEGKFAQDLGVNVDRNSHIIQVFFQHPNPVLAAETLKVLEDQYFLLRGKLFADKQAAIVEADQSRAGTQLAAADARLADFKRVHNVADFTERQKILLAEQGSLEDQLTKAESTTAGLQARLDGLSVQLKLASGQPNAKGNPNTAGALQGMVQAYQKRQADALTTYRGSPAYDTARTEMMKAQEEIAKMRSTQAFNLQQEFNKTEADLRTSQATGGAVKAQLTSIADELASINANESQLHELERTRGVLEENYKAIAKVATDRQVIEDVGAKQQPSIRIVEEPRIPDRPKPIRMEILLVGAIVGLVVSLITSLMSGFFRGVYLRPEALELDTGLAVLAVVPDHRTLASPVVLVTPQ
jgi:uncharacterized protein involved in exopolysaccharide biosynthesis